MMISTTLATYTQGTFTVSTSIHLRSIATMKLARRHWVLMAFMRTTRSCHTHWRMKRVKVNLLSLLMGGNRLTLGILSDVLTNILISVIFICRLFSCLCKNLLAFLMLWIYISLQFSPTITIMNEFF